MRIRPASLARLLTALTAALVGVVGISGCGDDSAPDAGPEAGRDTGPDTGRDTGMADAGPMCDGGCAGSLRCCMGTDGVARCVDPANDSDNCGICGRICAEGFGTECVRGTCVCGSAMLGCGGVRRSLCCPPRDGGVPHCANLDEDAPDCGECNNACDPLASDRCELGRCTCGEGRSACAGTPEDTCCSDSFAFVGCVDTTTDRFHCGLCNNACMGSETCIAGTCTRGAECAGGCDEGFICCRGECCTRGTCDLGTCGPPEDAGAGGGG